jgi:hypothetical protein
MNMKSKGQSKTQKLEGGAGRRPLKPRALGKWSGEQQPHRSAPTRVRRPLVRRPAR